MFLPRSVPVRYQLSPIWTETCKVLKIAGSADIFCCARNLPDMKYHICVFPPRYDEITVTPRLLWLLLQPLPDLQHCQWHGQEWIPLLLARPHLPLHPCHPPQKTSKREIWYWGWFPIDFSQIGNPPHLGWWWYWLCNFFLLHSLCDMSDSCRDEAEGRQVITKHLTIIKSAQEQYF